MNKNYENFSQEFMATGRLNIFPEQMKKWLVVWIIKETTNNGRKEYKKPGLCEAAFNCVISIHVVCYYSVSFEASLTRTQLGHILIQLIQSLDSTNRAVSLRLFQILARTHDTKEKNKHEMKK